MTTPQPHSYAIFEANDTETLSHLVNEAQQHGWRAQGGVAVAPAIADGITVGFRYLQSMVQSKHASQ